MNIKEQENQLAINLNLRIIVNIVAYLCLAGFVGYRLYLVSRPTPGAVVSGVAVPRLKVSNYEALQTPPQTSNTGVGRVPIPVSEPFD